jgi:hypothetical protein
MLSQEKYGHGNRDRYCAVGAPRFHLGAFWMSDAHAISELPRISAEGTFEPEVRITTGLRPDPAGAQAGGVLAPLHGMAGGRQGHAPAGHREGPARGGSLSPHAVSPAPSRALVSRRGSSRIRGELACGLKIEY